jgi:hypothetical protein
MLNYSRFPLNNYAALQYPTNNKTIESNHIMKTTTKPEVLKVSDYALIHDIPEWAIYPLEYGEGKEDMRDEDLENIEEWEKDYFLVCPVDDQPEAHFTSTPAFGLPCDCVKYYVLPRYMGAVLSWINPGCRMTNCYLELRLTDGSRVKVYLKGNQTLRSTIRNLIGLVEMGHTFTNMNGHNVSPRPRDIVNFWVRTMHGQTLATGRI